MKRTALRLLVLGLLLTGVAGCDSAEDGQSDAELMIGTWEAGTVRVNGQDVTNLVSILYEEITARFTAENTFTLTAQARDPQNAVDPLIGTYVVNEGTQTLTLTVNTLDGTATQPMQYEFKSENRIDLTFTTDGSLISGIQGNVVLTIDRKASGS